MGWKGSKMKMKAKRRAGKWQKGYIPKKTSQIRLARLKKIEKLIQERKRADVVASCATRTVEWPSTHKTAEEKHKLLFALCLGLIPKYENRKVEPSLMVKVTKLDPEVEALARASTQRVINDLILQRQAGEPERPQRSLILEPLYLLPEVEEPRVSPENCELVDLVSDDDDSESIVDVEDDAPTYELITLTDDEDVASFEKPEEIRNIAHLILSKDNVPHRQTKNNAPNQPVADPFSMNPVPEQPNSWIISQNTLDRLSVTVPPSQPPTSGAVPIPAQPKKHTKNGPNYTPLPLTPQNSGSQPMNHFRANNNHQKKVTSKNLGNSGHRQLKLSKVPSPRRVRPRTHQKNELASSCWSMESEA